jgi:hypothetical protein
MGAGRYARQGITDTTIRRDRTLLRALTLRKTHKWKYELIVHQVAFVNELQERTACSQDHQINTLAALTSEIQFTLQTRHHSSLKCGRGPP